MANEFILNYELNKNFFLVGNESQLIYLLIDAKPTVRQFATNAPINLCLVMDRSASMKGLKIENVKIAIGNIIDRMTENDYLSLVIFNEEAEVPVPGQPITDKDLLKKLVNQIIPKNGTTISTGMKAGLEELRKHFAVDRINRMILLTDGQTYGDEEACYHLASEAFEAGILITALGVGDEWHEEVLDTIAEKSNGRSDYIATPNEIIPIFDEELTNLQNIIGQSAMLTLRFSKDVKLRKICRVIPSISELAYNIVADNLVTINLGELNNDQGQSILAEVIVMPQPKGKYRISQAELIYDIPGANRFQQKVRNDISIEFSDNEMLCKKINARVMNIVEKVSAYDLQTKAFEQAASGDLMGATKKLQAAATRLLNLNEQELADTALQEARNLAQQGVMTSAGTKKLRYETRKLTQRL